MYTVVSVYIISLVYLLTGNIRNMRIIIKEETKKNEKEINGTGFFGCSSGACFQYGTGG